MDRDKELKERAKAHFLSLGIAFPGEVAIEDILNAYLAGARAVEAELEMEMKAVETWKAAFNQSLAESAVYREALEKAKCACKVKPFTHQYVFTCDRCKALSHAPAQAQKLLDVVQLAKNYVAINCADPLLPGKLLAAENRLLSALDALDGPESVNGK